MMVTPPQRWWWLLRLAVAMVWLYQGLWSKVIAVDPRHLDIVAAVPSGLAPRLLLGLIGAIEGLFGVVTLLRWRPRPCAWLQVIALVAMNGGGILFAAAAIPDIPGMVLMNLVFALAIWGLAHHAPRT